MKTFKDFYILNEGRFRDSNKLTHIMDVPMFSIFTEPKYGEYINSSEINSNLKTALEVAKTRIQKMGFPSMHVNVVFQDTPGAFGVASGNPEARKHSLRHIDMNRRFLDHLLFANHRGLDKYNPDQMISTLVHEWGHIWMYNNGQKFRNAVKQYHEALTHSNIDKVPHRYEDPIRIFQDFYNRLGYQIQNNYLKKQNVKLINIQDNIETFLLDVLNAFGMYALAIDRGVIKKYSNIIGEIVFNNLQTPHEILKQIRELDLEKVFGNIVKQETQRSLLKKTDICKQLSDMVNFTGAYGLKNPDETWATAIQKFGTLDPYHRKRILELMQVRGPREAPNKRMQKHLKSKT